MYVAEGWIWATHQPLILAMMEYIKPKFILELGIGIYSTPLFLKTDVKYLGVENDKGWIEKLKEKYDIEIIHHDLIDFIDGIPLTALSEEQKTRITKFYDNVPIPDITERLLFVDQYSGCRTLSINVLKTKFNYIIFHDYDRFGLKANNYELINMDGFNIYILKTTETGTAIMIKKEFDIGLNMMKEITKPYIDGFLETYKDCKLMELTNE